MGSSSPSGDARPAEPDDEQPTVGAVEHDFTTPEDADLTDGAGPEPA